MKNLAYLSAAAFALALSFGAFAQTVNQLQAPLEVNAKPFTNTANDLIIGAGPGLVQDENQATAPAYASGGCTTTPAVAGSPYAFVVTQGASGCAGSTMVFTLPTPGNAGKWVCDAHDITNPTTTIVEESGAAGTSITFTNYTRTTGAALTWVASDVIVVKCVS